MPQKEQNILQDSMSAPASFPWGPKWQRMNFPYK